MRARGSLLALAAVLAVTTAGAAGPVQQLAADASVHRVEVVDGIKHTVIRDGIVTVTLVPGTGDAAPDLDPALEIDPVTASAVVVWSRDDGSGFDVWIARYQGDVWSAPLRVLGDPGSDELAPRVQITDEAVHVVARGEGGYLRVTLDRSSLAPLFGPETLPAGPEGIVPGVEGQGDEPPPGAVFFASDVTVESPESPGEVVIWGVRDEPVPIDYVESLLLPAGIEDFGTPLAAPVEGSLAVLVPTATRVWYTFYLQGSWAEFRAVDMDASTTMADVRLMVAGVIRRLQN